MMKHKTKNNLRNTEIIHLLLLFAAAILACCFFKISSLFLILILILVGLKAVGKYDKINFLQKQSFVKICIVNIALFLWFAAFFAMFFKSQIFVSNIGNLIAALLKKCFGSVGSAALLFSPVGYLAWKLYRKHSRKNNTTAIISKPIPTQPQAKQPAARPKTDATDNPAKPNLPEETPKNHRHKFPPLDLLKDYPDENEQDIVEEIENKKQIIKQTLGDFGINVTEITATVGAAVTLYELFLARGVAANKIKTIDEDIARCLKVQAVRVISPFKDRGTVALEAPNNKSQIVGLKSILKTVEFQNCEYELPLALGKTIDDKPKIIDLAEMLHILIGGATGQGKSVCLNAMLSSLLYTKSPAELKLVLIDPKVNEFSIYKKLGKRFNAPRIPKTVFTNDFDEIADALQALREEMNRRLRLFERANVRNIQEYNADKKVGNADYLPRIVVVIDEFVDILGGRNKANEEALLELVRKSRAQGIHLIVATQRPSAKQCSSEITSQFTARIAFKVIKWQNSDIILGDSGAEKLTGKGDMLFSFNSEMERLQGAFVSTDEVRNVVEFIEK